MASDKPKILLFSHLCSTHALSGSEKTLLLLMEELTRHYQPILIVPAEGLLEKAARTSGMTVRHIPYHSFWSALNKKGVNPLQQAALFRDPSLPALTRLIREEQPALVVANTAVNWLPLIAAKRAQVPSLWWFQEVIPQRSAPVFHSFIHHHADWLLGSSRSTLSFVQNHPLKKRSFLLYPSWKPEAYQPETWLDRRQQQRAQWGLSPDDVLIGFIALRMTRHKGYHHFLTMASHLIPQEANVHFLLRSDPSRSPFSQRRSAWIAQQGWGQRFHTCAFKDDIQDIYPALDLLVVPSLAREGFGLTAMEAMIFGKPVVAYASGGLSELMHKTNNRSFLVPRGQIAGLTHKVQHLVQHPHLRLQRGEQNRQQVKAAFGVESFRRQLHRLFQRLLGGGDHD